MFKTLKRFLRAFKNPLKGQILAFKGWRIRGKEADYSSYFYDTDEMGFVFRKGTCPRHYVDVRRR
ncbi:MAG: hypothetical protein LBG21_00085 [Campylobacteraceae bacterium]|jgi:hypothetical protein|nr:hypothetical protein [Campylobacteraceae bacterium]